MTRSYQTLADRFPRSFPLCAATIVYLVASLPLSVSRASGGLTFAGVPLTPGGTVQANVPLSDLEKSYVSEGGNPVPSHAVAVLAVPPPFDPKRIWPVMVAFASSEHGHQNAYDLRMIWSHYAFREGWIALAGDGPTPAPRVDSSGWRAGHTLAALDALNRSFPGSRQWPIVLVGQSGGAKRASYLAPLFAVAGYRMAGIFLTGINEDRITDGCRHFKPPRDFFSIPIFLSSGDQDRIATPNQQLAVENFMRRTGFTNIRHKTFAGGHEGSADHVFEALRWFRSGIEAHHEVPSAKP
jgi:hypothetical protein